ncbi:MAG: DUF3048 domain-containing protein [Chloroflexi bacterium]|nr:DUF3048 domain-containing protein [Chloroflexota bacterium]
MPSPRPALQAAPSPSASSLAPSSPPTVVAQAQSQSDADSEFQFDAYPFAAMIDNIAAARPQFGLGDADVVYEAPAEGGIPRLMPIFLRGGVDVSRIGPVRSARHYFVDMAEEYGVALVHIGASPQGIEALSASQLPDLDEERGDPGFTRVRDRIAPHNAFVSTNSVRDALHQRGATLKPSVGPLRFGTYAPGPQPATTVKIAYPGGERYKVEYDYDANTQLYNRIMDGSPHKDGATGDQYAAASIIIQYADVQPIPNDNAGRMNVTLVSSGKGILIAEGTQVPLEWSRASLQDSTRFVRTDGAPFELPSGQVWIQVVPLETPLSVS